MDENRSDTENAEFMQDEFKNDNKSVDGQSSERGELRTSQNVRSDNPLETSAHTHDSAEETILPSVNDSDKKHKCELMDDSSLNDSSSADFPVSEHGSDTSSVGSESSQGSTFLRDYGYMKHINNVLPSRAQRGLSSFPLKINCIDATEHFIAIGCNIDILFLYHRKGSGLQRLKCLSSDFDSITSIKVISSIELMVAAGSSSGAVVVFKVPILPNTESEMEKYVVKKIHRHSIANLQWSQNAMKLYSGDTSGLVVCTNIMYDKHGCYSNEVLRESSSIVQLDYYQQMLLVSTLNRTFVCHISENNRIMQLGVKPRKFPGNFGAQFYVTDVSASRKLETLVYTTRPGLRVWKANAAGIVLETILYKDVLSKDMTASALLGSTSSESRSSQFDQQFGPILLFQKKYLVLYTKSYIFVVDPNNSSVMGSFNSEHSIIYVCVTDQEILVLQENSSIIRLATKPEKRAQSTVPKFDDKNFKRELSSVQAGLKDLGLKTQSRIMKKFKEINASNGNVKQSKQWKLPIDAVTLPKPRQFFQEFSGILVHPDAAPDASQSSESKMLVPECEDLTIVNSEPAEADKVKDNSKNISSKISTSKEAVGNNENFDRSSLNVKEDVEKPAPKFGLKSSSDVSFDELVYKPKKAKTKKKPKSQNVLLVSMENDSSDADISQNASTNDLTAVSKFSSDQTNTESSVTDSVNDGDVKDHLDLESEEKNLYKEINSEQSFVQPSQVQREEFLAQILTLDNKPKEVEISPQKEIETDLGSVAKPVLESDATNSNKKLPLKLSVAESVNENSSNDIYSSINAPNTPNTPIELGSDTIDSSKKSPLRMSAVKPVNKSSSGVYLSTLYSPDVISEDHVDGNMMINESNKGRRQSMENTSDIVVENLKTEALASELAQRQISEFDELDDSIPNASAESKYCDHWMLHEGPGQLINLSISKRYIVCVDNKDRVFYSHLTEPGLLWHHLDYHAHQIAVSESGMMVWRLYNGIVYVAKLGSCDPYKPTVSSWIEITKNVLWIAVDDWNAWIIKLSGSIYMLPNIREVNKFTEVFSFDANIKMKQIVCLDDVVWALTSDGKLMCRNGITKSCKQGEYWKDVRSNKEITFVSISLCTNKTGWAVDETGSLWFKMGVTADFPEGVDVHWWAVGISGYIYRDSSNLDNLKAVMGHIYPKNFMTALSLQYPRQLNVSLSTGDNGVWFCSKDSKELWGNNSYVIGHRLERFHMINLTSNSVWSFVHAESIFENEGFLWFLKKTGELFYIQLIGSKLHQVRLPNPKITVACIAPSPQALWILTDTSEIWILPIRKQTYTVGNIWELLPLYQIDDVELTHISCSTDVVWACDKRGNVHMRIGSLGPPNSSNLSPAWIPVDCNPPEGSSSASKGIIPSQLKLKPEYIHFTKIYVGSNSYMVWAIDNKKNVYAREGISDNFHVGTNWAYVCGIQVQQLAISNRAVWALTVDGSIYRRFGISDSNCIGDYWKLIPGKLQFLTVTSDDDLWGLSSTGIAYQHLAKQLQYEGRNRAESSDRFLLKSKESIDDADWEVV